MAGYWQKILEVNLTEGSLKDVVLGEDYYRNFIGGTGLGARLLLDRLDPAAAPLSPDAPMIITTGPLTASRIIGAVTRFSVTGRSPYTGGWGESSCGGTLGVMLKRNGYDGVIITGAAKNPVYLEMIDGACELRDASQYWGKDAYDTADAMKADIKSRAGKSASVFCIGTAGEKLVRFANIVNDKHQAAGRCGFGALMGSKNLKAIAAWGSKKPEFAEPEKLDALRDSIKEKMDESISVMSMTEFGTNGGMDLGSMTGDVPIKNWSLGEWDEGINNINGPTMSDTILTRNTACFGCTVACKRVVKVEDEKYNVPEGAGPEYETVAVFGSMNLIGDLKPISVINEICNRAGVDTISCGGTVAWLNEAAGKGLVSKEQLGGVDLKWGDADAVIAIVKMICARDGIGDILADGSRAASKKLGFGEDFLVEVKGLEAPMHDPRAFWGMGLDYATGNRGACHVNTANLLHEFGFCFYPGIGLGEESPPHQVEGKAFDVMTAQNMGSFFNSLCICNFPAMPWDENDFLNSLNYSTGFGFTLESMIETGARIWLLKRGINCLLGITRADDRLPARLLTPLSEGATADLAIELQPMLADWYKARDIDEQGRPSRATLEKHGLKALADKLHG